MPCYRIAVSVVLAAPALAVPSGIHSVVFLFCTLQVGAYDLIGWSRNSNSAVPVSMDMWIPQALLHSHLLARLHIASVKTAANRSNMMYLFCPILVCWQIQGSMALAPDGHTLAAGACWASSWRDFLTERVNAM